MTGELVKQFELTNVAGTTKKPRGMGKVPRGLLYTAKRCGLSGRMKWYNES
jgi:hypothetical protein